MRFFKKPPVASGNGLGVDWFADHFFIFWLAKLFEKLVERHGVVNMMSLAQAPGIMTAVNNLTAADFFLAIAFQSWQNRCDEKKNCISNACRDHIALR